MKKIKFKNNTEKVLTNAIKCDILFIVNELLYKTERKNVMKLCKNTARTG